MRKKIRNTLALLLAAVMLLALPSAAFSSDTSFPDIQEGAWYADYIDKCAMLEIVNGYEDGTFQPDVTLKRCEFIKMLACSGESLIIPTVSSTYWAARYYQALYEQGVFSGLSIDGSYQSLEQSISRYEMAVMVENFLTNVQWETKANTSSPEKVISDYSAIPSAYVNAVVQVYGKGVITGMEDGSFEGGDLLTRAQACAVIVRILWNGERTVASFVQENQVTNITEAEGYVPFATWARQVGYLSSYGTPSAELKQILFGNSSKSYFTSSSDASSYMETVTVNVWKLNTNGSKYASTASITVNKAVANDVRGIFQMIFEDPEQFPIQSVGGARYTDTLRHSWGCAIDINPYQNCECRVYYNTGAIDITCGLGWWPIGTNASVFSGGLGSPSVYSIGSGTNYGHSVVDAFKAYGWGWGGQGYSVRSSDNSQKFDFMHFSILTSGG